MTTPSEKTNGGSPAEGVPLSGKRNGRGRKLPFAVSFITRSDGSRLHRFTQFTDKGGELLENAPPGLSVAENQDIYLRFEAPPEFRFTMDGLDVVSVPGADRVNGQSYIRPTGKAAEPLLLLEGRDFPLVPGYYVMTVSGWQREWYGILEITPKFIGRQSWQDMRDELVEEIRTLSFDFMKRSIHISRSMEGTLGLNTSMLLRFYTINDESESVLQVLGELSRTANARLALKKEVLRRGGTAGAHIRPDHVHARTGSDIVSVMKTEMNWNVAENRFAKAILGRLDENLRTFIEEIDLHASQLGKRQESLRDYGRNREFRTGEKALSHFTTYRQRAVRIRNAIRMVTRATWFHEAEGTMPAMLPMTVFRDPRYSVLYRLHRNLEHPSDSLSVSSFYQFQWKRTDKLYELWCFLQFIKALEEKEWELQEGPAVIREEGKYRLASLEEGTEILLSRGEERIRLVYDGLVPQSSLETDREKAPLYTNNVHRRPDLRMDYYRGGSYFGSLVADFKYRDIYFLWRDAARSGGIRTQFNAYRDMNTKFYREMEETESLRNSRPVKEVWAVFPKEIPPGGDEDFSLRFISLAPGLKVNEQLADMLENYISSLHQ